MAELESNATKPQDAAPVAAAPTASADDQIAELATEDLDRMLSAAEVDRAAPNSSQPIETSAAPQNTPATTEAPSSSTELKTQNAVDDIVAQALASIPEDMAELDSLPSHPETPAETALPPPPGGETATPAATETSETVSEAPAADERLPFYLLPLDWLYRPMRAIPDPLIDALGKVAILTLINAAGILIYVHHFRHK